MSTIFKLILITLPLVVLTLFVLDLPIASKAIADSTEEAMTISAFRRDHVRLYDADGNKVAKIPSTDLSVGHPVSESRADMYYAIEIDGKKYWVTSSDVKVGAIDRVICQEKPVSADSSTTTTTTAGVDTDCLNRKNASSGKKADD